MFSTIHVYISHGRKAIDYGVFEITSNDSFDAMLNYLDSIKGYKPERFWLSSLNFFVSYSDKKFQVTSGTRIAINRSRVRDLQDFMRISETNLRFPRSNGNVVFANRTRAMLMHDVFPVSFPGSHGNSKFPVLGSGTFVHPTDAKVIYPDIEPWVFSRAKIDGGSDIEGTSVNTGVRSWDESSNWLDFQFKWCPVDDIIAAEIL